MKGGKEHRVPLSDRALAILAELPREAGSDAVFPGRSAGGFMNQDAMADVLAKLRRRRDGARLPLGLPRLGGGDDGAIPIMWSKWPWRTRSRTVSRPLTGAATCSRSGGG